MPLGDFRRGPRPRLELCDDLHLLLDGDRLRPGVRPTVPSLAGGDLVYPVAQHLAALRIPQRPHRARQALPVAQVVLDGLAPHFQGVLRLALVLGDGHLARLPVFAPPVSQRMPVGVAELRYRVGVAVVKPDEGLYRDPSLLGAVHADSFLFLFGPGFPPQSQMADLNRR